MLQDKNAAATVAVTDMAVAKKFYSETLGLELVREMGEGGVVYKAGGSRLFVYVSQFARTNKANAVTWDCGDELDAIVKDLRAKGVAFEHYDNLPNTKREGDIHVSGSFRLAWFKDPDGNLHAMGNG